MQPAGRRQSAVFPKQFTQMFPSVEAPPPVRHSITTSLQKDTSSNNIKVVARFRPKNELETNLEEGKPEIVKFLSIGTMVVGEGKDKETVTFDRIFPPNVSQQEVFDVVGVPVIEDVLTGYNGTVFAYGQTGSGKTYSMMGIDVYDEELSGIIPRAASKIFHAVEESEGDVEFLLTCSMLEIYKETLNDLLTEEPRHLKIKEDPRRGIYVQGLTEVSVDCEDDMLEVIALGEQMRTVGTTRCNAVSSRSHQIFILEIKQKFPNDSEKRGILNLVDLAGSEKVHLSGVTGNGLQEAKKINLSLSALGNVIHALISGSEHVPYRDSKLTRLLQESLGGNYKTTLLVALSPCYHHYDETMNSIKFAQRAKNIKNKVTINIKNSPEAYIQMIEKLTNQLQRANREILVLRGDVIREMVDKSVNTDNLTPSAQRRRMSAIDPQLIQSQFGMMSLKVLKEIGEPRRLSEEQNSGDSEAYSDQRKPNISVDLSESMMTSFSGQHTDRGGVASYVESGSLKSVSIDKYQRMKHKYRAKLRDAEAKRSLISEEKENLESKVAEMDLNLRSSRKNSLAEKQKAYKYYELYHKSMHLINKDEDENGMLRKQVASLELQIRQLTHTLEVLDGRFRRFIEETENGRSNTVLEFADLADASEFEEQEVSDMDESRLPEAVLELPIDSQILVQSQVYSERLLRHLETNSVLKEEMAVYQMKNQAIQAGFINANLMRVSHALMWKNALISHKYTMKRLLAEHQTERIKQLETMLDYLHDAYNSISTLSDKLGGDTLKSSIIQESYTPRPRILKPFSKGTSQRRLFRKKSEKPTIDMSKVRGSFGERSSFMEGESVDQQIGGGRNHRYRNLEANLQMQTNYNTGLKETLKECQEELKLTQKFMASVQMDVYSTHQQERMRWNRFLDIFKDNCERELLRKQEEVVQLNQLLSAWIQKFMGLQDQVGIPSSEAPPRLSPQFETDLKQLCAATNSAVTSLTNPVERIRMLATRSPIFSEKTCSAKYMTTVTLGSGDESPPLCEGD